MPTRRRSPLTSPASLAAGLAATAVITLVNTSSADAAVTEPTPGTSGYQPWPTARPGGDQQATEQQNFNTYYSTPMYNATDPSADQRNADGEAYLVEIYGDLKEDIHPGLRAAALSPWASDVANLGRQLPFLLHASGPKINPLSVADSRNLNDANQWMQSMDLTPDGIANPDPATQQAERQLEDRAIPHFLYERYYERYRAQRYSESDAARFAKVHVAGMLAARKSQALFTSAQVTQLSHWYYDGVEFIDSTQKLVSTWRNFKRVSEYAREHLQMEVGVSSRLAPTTVQRAVEGIGAYAPGKIDKNGVAFPDPRATPIANQCPTGYTCPPLADPPT
jgi:hypothetical protein